MTQPTYHEYNHGEIYAFVNDDSRTIMIGDRYESPDIIGWIILPKNLGYKSVSSWVMELYYDIEYIGTTEKYPEYEL